VLATAIACLLLHAPPAQGDPRATTEGMGASAEDIPPLIGDETLAPHLSLSDLEEANGHYTARLPDGSPMHLTLVPALQKRAEAALRNAAAPVGAVLLLDVSGRILAAAGRRGGARPKRDPELPFWSGAPAASVFKVITAAALLANGYQGTRDVCYHGGRSGVKATHLVDSEKDTACENLSHALARSTNVIFAKLANRYLSEEGLSKMAKAFGLGAAPEFAVTSDKGRVRLPTSGIEFARAAAGFYHVNMSPLQGALIAALVANEGRAVTPRIVEAVRRPGGLQDVLSHPRQPKIPEAVASRLSQMMGETVARGTGYRGFHDQHGHPYLPGVEIAGKTGSLTKDGLKYSWFVGFAPTEAPEIAFAVLIGNGRKWRLKATDVARMVLQTALGK